MRLATLPDTRAARDARGPASAGEYGDEVLRRSPAKYKLPAVSLGRLSENPAGEIGKPDPRRRFALSAK